MNDVKEALEAGAEVIMLDNMSPSQIQQAVALIDKAATIEVSGGIELATIAEYALPGVDVISIGQYQTLEMFLTGDGDDDDFLAG